MSAPTCWPECASRAGSTSKPNGKRAVASCSSSPSASGSRELVLPERDERLYLTDMLSAIDRALDDSRQGRDEFFSDPQAQEAVLRSIKAMGEAARGVSEATRQAHPGIPWSRIIGTADQVVPGSLQVNLDRVWDIVEKELPK